MSWSKEWPKIGKAIMDEGPNTKSNDWPDEPSPANSGTVINAVYQASQLVGWDFGKDDKVATVIISKAEDGQITVDKVYDNKMPTHDPYVNPNSHIYYQCGCGAILDPGTKSFAALNNHASNTGWKVRWNKDGLGYQPFCVDCGKNVE